MKGQQMFTPSHQYNSRMRQENRMIAIFDSYAKYTKLVTVGVTHKTRKKQFWENPVIDQRTSHIFFNIFFKAETETDIFPSLQQLFQFFFQMVDAPGARFLPIVFSPYPGYHPRNYARAGGARMFTGKHSQNPCFGVLKMKAFSKEGFVIHHFWDKRWHRKTYTSMYQTSWV